MVDSFYKPRPVYAPILPPQKVPRPQWKKIFIANPLKTVEKQRRKGGADSPISVASTTDSPAPPVTVTNGDEVAMYDEVGNTKKFIPMKPDVIQPGMRPPSATSSVTPGSDEGFRITATVSDKPFTKEAASDAHEKAAAKPFSKRRIGLDLTDSPPQEKSENFKGLIPSYKPSPSPSAGKAISGKDLLAKSVKSAGMSSSKTASTPFAPVSAKPSAKGTPPTESTPMKEAILIRVQHSATQSIPFRMKPTTFFSHLMDQALKKLGAEIHRGFIFEGKLLQPSSTPKDVDMQEGDVVVGEEGWIDGCYLVGGGEGDREGWNVCILR